MNASTRASAGWISAWWLAWDQFWFTPAAPHTLCAIRILAGAMLFYTHFIWSLDLTAFLGPDSWMSAAAVRELSRDSYAWSYLWYVESPALLWALHLAALGVFALLTLGLFTRVVSVLAAVITLAYCHRLPGALFGLHQVNAMLAMYLAVGPAGATYSLDRWRAARGAGQGTAVGDSTSANIAIRLIQLHLCIIYLFGGIGKMRGELWWDGSAVWFAVANYEYQSWDMTWLIHYPWLVALLTHVTVFWETFYAFLVWPRSSRPIALAIAVFVHGGIALFLGMPTFGLAMLIANLAFVPPGIVNRVIPSKLRA
jgi:hypothetical protein